MKMKFILPLLISFLLPVAAGDFPRTLKAYPGKTPKIDAVLDPGEWADAIPFEGVSGEGNRKWISTFSPTTDAKDLALKGWVKHDEKRLYFAFEITDDVLYGIDTNLNTLFNSYLV